MRITVIGTGYVGLVTGTCFAENGHSVWCIDVDAKIIENLNNGMIPIYEPGLEELITKNRQAGRLNFSTDIQDGLKGAEICFIAVGTPPRSGGGADMAQVLTVADNIGCCLDHPCVVVVKSTVPVGTSRLLYRLIEDRLRERNLGCEVEIVSNPEFLKEGMAIEDCLNPDRVVVGAASQHAREMMNNLYSSFVSEDKIIFMDPASAEITKYAANAMLATRISFMNEIARLCDAVGADIISVKNGIGSDRRIGSSFLNAGCGYGGSCFPKDVTALCAIGDAYGVDLSLVSAVDKVNLRQKRILPVMLRRRFGESMLDITISILGLAFKPHTDDMREAPSVTLINMLLDYRANVVVYDPIAGATAKAALPDGVCYAASAEEALTNADAAVIVTEWPEFKRIDWEKMGGRMKQKILFDGRNLYDPAAKRALGFEYYCIGRGCTPEQRVSPQEN